MVGRTSAGSSKCGLAGAVGVGRKVAFAEKAASKAKGDSGGESGRRDLAKKLESMVGVTCAAGCGGSCVCCGRKRGRGCDCGCDCACGAAESFGDGTPVEDEFEDEARISGVMAGVSIASSRLYIRGVCKQPKEGRCVGEQWPIAMGGRGLGRSQEEEARCCREGD